MKETLQQLDILKIHASKLDCHIYNGGDSSTDTDEELLTEPSSTRPLDFDNTEYRLPHLLSDRPTHEHVSSVYFQHSLVHTRTETKIINKVNDTTQQSG